MVDTFFCTGQCLLLVFNRHILAGCLLKDTASIYCQHLCHDGCSSIRTHFRIPSEIFSVVEWDWPWPALLRAVSTPLSIATDLISLMVIWTGRDGMLLTKIVLLTGTSGNSSSARLSLSLLGHLELKCDIRFVLGDWQEINCERKVVETNSWGVWVFLYSVQVLSRACGWC